MGGQGEGGEERRDGEGLRRGKLETLSIDPGDGARHPIAEHRKAKRQEMVKFERKPYRWCGPLRFRVHQANTRAKRLLVFCAPHAPNSRCSSSAIGIGEQA